MRSPMVLPYACTCGHKWRTTWDGTMYSDVQQDCCPKCGNLCDPDETSRIFEMTPLGFLACLVGDELADEAAWHMNDYMCRHKKSIVSTTMGLAFRDNAHFGKQNTMTNNEPKENQ